MKVSHLVYRDPNTFFRRVQLGKYKDLSDQIWTTRISRVNAEKRLITFIIHVLRLYFRYLHYLIKMKN